MTQETTPDLAAASEVSTEDAFNFLENALRNWPRVRFDKDDLEDVRKALQFFAKQRLAALTKPAVPQGERECADAGKRRDCK